MGRLKRLKERNDKIKVTACSLALALVIGSTQGLGTYALFTDTEDVASNLAISTGDVDVEVSGKSTFNDLSSLDTKTGDSFIITNNGTLRQNIKLNIKNLLPETEKELTDSQKQALEYLENNLKYSISFGVEDNEEPLGNEVGQNVKDIVPTTISQDVILLHEEYQTNFILNPGEQITAKLSIHIPSLNNIIIDNVTLDLQNLLSEIGSIRADLHVQASQISSDYNEFVDNGFYDVSIQQNTISIKEKIMAIVEHGNAHYTDKHGNEFKKLFIPVDVKGTDYKFDLSAKVESYSGDYNATYKNYEGMDYILIESKSLNEPLPFKGHVNITITVVVKDKEGKTLDNYDLKCNVYLNNAGNSCKGELEDHVMDSTGNKCHVEEVKLGHKTENSLLEEELKQDLEISIEDIEEQSKPDALEAPNEKIEKSSKSDVVELANIEEILSSQSDIVEPPKVEEVVLPNNTDIILERKDETEIEE